MASKNEEESKEMFCFSPKSPSVKLFFFVLFTKWTNKRTWIKASISYAAKCYQPCCSNWRYIYRNKKNQTAHNQFHSIDLTESNFVRDLPTFGTVIHYNLCSTIIHDVPYCVWVLCCTVLLCHPFAMGLEILKQHFRIDFEEKKKCSREHFIKSDMKCTHCASMFILFQFQEKFSLIVCLIVFFFFSAYLFFSVYSIVWSLCCCVKRNDSLWNKKYWNDEWNINFNVFVRAQVQLLPGSEHAHSHHACFVPIWASCVSYSPMQRTQYIEV